MKTDSREISKIIKDRNDNRRGAPQLVFDDKSQNIIAVPAGTAEDTGMPEVTTMGTDVFHYVAQYTVIL
jgi:hypothetical protein